MDSRETDVLIIGGGAAGLSAALYCADLGVDALTFERRPGTSVLPKAHILNPRTMEIFALHRIADQVYAEGTPEENHQSVSWYMGLGGDEPGNGKMFHRTDAWGGGSHRARYAAASAYRGGNMPQRDLEPLLRRHAEERAPGAQFFNHEVSSLEQDDDGVTAVVVDGASGEETTVRARYAIGADGGRTVGPAVGIELEGPPSVISVTSIQIRADLSPYLEDDDASIRIMAKPLPDGTWIRGGLVCMGPKRWDRHAEVWRVSVTRQIGESNPDYYDKELAKEDVRRQLGLPDLELEVEVINAWLQESVLADRYAVGRVFVAGDAAHRHSPHGGLGLNCAIQDTHNLTWKLAAVLSGAAHPDLLDSYELERRPVARRNVEWATFNSHNNNAIVGPAFGLLPGAGEANTRAVLAKLFSDTPDGRARRTRLAEFYEVAKAELVELDVELGFEYADSPVVAPDASPAPPRHPTGEQYVPVARPGHRLPHTWVGRGAERLSTHDLLRPGRFLLLAGPHGDQWHQAAVRVAGEFGVELDAYRLGTDLVDLEKRWRGLCGHAAEGAVLVRPDGHVGFRAAGAAADPESMMEAALRTLLGLPVGELAPGGGAEAVAEAAR